MTRRCDCCVHFHDLPWHNARRMLEMREDQTVVVVGTRQVGECRARPPERGYRGGVWHDPERAFWPVVYGEEFCGAFTPAGGPEKVR